MNTPLRCLFAFVTTVLLCFSSTAAAELILAEGQATGSWFNPERSGEGFFVEIADINGANMFTVAMYTFDASGDPLWLTGNLPIDSDDVTVEVPMYQYDGPLWGPDFDPTQLNTTLFGTMRVTFTTCDTALFQMDSDTELADGSYSLVRLTNIEGIDCTDTPPQQGFTPGRWTGEGVCFNVAADGLSLTEVGSTCDQGAAFDSNLDNGKENGLGGDCGVEADCEGVWKITAGSFHCAADLGTLVVGQFDSFTSASGKAFEGEGGKSDYCVANWSATPD